MSPAPADPASTNIAIRETAVTNNAETFSPPARRPKTISAFAPAIPAAFLGPAWLGNLAHLGFEITSFVADRIQKDIKTQHALMHCKTLAEVQHVQARFLQEAFDQYHAETGRLVEMANKMTTGPLSGDEASTRN